MTTWPVSILTPRSVSIHLANRTLAGGAALNGRMQVSASDAGVWTCSFNEIPVHDRSTVLSWRAMQMVTEGRLGAVDVPMLDYEAAYSAYAAGLDYDALTGSVPHSDDAYFADDAGYIGQAVEIYTADSAALRATQVTINVVYGPRIEAGQIFSITHLNKGPRWYQIKSYDSTTGVLVFRPTLREAVSIGVALDFDRPICRMRLASDGEMRLELSLPAHGFPSVTFVEDL